MGLSGTGGNTGPLCSQDFASPCDFLTDHIPKVKSQKRHGARAFSDPAVLEQKSKQNRQGRYPWRSSLGSSTRALFTSCFGHPHSHEADNMGSCEQKSKVKEHAKSERAALGSFKEKVTILTDGASVRALVSASARPA